jgi:Fe-S cluster biogenesis protein NfuA
MSTSTETPSITARVQAVIDWLRPVIQADGGDVELINVTDDGIVQVKFHGACIGCPSSTMTLKQGLERNIKEKVPEVRDVVPV